MRYSARAGDLVRFTNEDSDHVIAEFVREATRSQLTRASVRERLTPDENYLLVLFARRRTVAAIRGHALPLALEAVDALTLVEEPKIDFRDVSVDFPLFAVRELGGDLDAVIGAAVESSGPGTAQSFAAKRERSQSLSLRDCALVRVSTSHGVGFMEDWTGSASPPVALAELAVRLADSIEDEGSYTGAQLNVSDLPSVWFGGKEDFSERVRGCVSIDTRHITSKRPFSHGLLVFLAEVADEPTAAELCERVRGQSTKERPRIGLADRRLLVSFIAGSATHRERSKESADSLARFCSIAQPLLRSFSLA